jgi:hypothetical protein
MMRALLPAIAALTAVLAAGAAAAQSQTQTDVFDRVTIDGNAPSVCQMNAPQGSGSNVQFSVNSSNSGQVDFQALANPNTAVAQASSVSVSFPVTCTGAHSLTISSTNGGLTNPSPGAQGFATRVDYALSAAWNGDTRQFTTVGTPTSLNLTESDGATGNLTVGITVPGGGLPLVSGAYTDQVTVQFSATP